MRDQRSCDEFRSWQELLTDPLITLVMQADHVDPRTLEGLLAKVERRAGAGCAPLPSQPAP